MNRWWTVITMCVFVANQQLRAAKNDSRSENKRPHIIMILADDLGFNDVPWHNKEVVAPNLQKLAESGVILEQSYVQPVCTPTRSAIMSGRYPFTIGRQGHVIWPLQPTGLTLATSVIPQYLKPLGYETHAIGKWHLGFCKWDYTPTERGFNTFRGFYTGSEDYYTHMRAYQVGKGKRKEDSKCEFIKSSDLVGRDQNKTSAERNSRDESPYKSIGYDFRDNKKIYYAAREIYSSYEFTNHVENILYSGDPNIPKFLYLAFQSVHSPLEVPINYTKPYMHIRSKKRRTYLGMVSAMDEAVGRIVTALKKTKHYENSVIAFTTDNGGPTITGGNNWPLRGNKTTLWEGGTRGAAFIHSPLITHPGRVSHNLFHATDWLATFVRIAGGPAPTGIDSINQWDALIGNAPPPREELIYDIFATNTSLSAGIRVGDYKLLIGNPGPGEWTPPPKAIKKKTRFGLTFPFMTKSQFSLATSSWSLDDHLRFLNQIKKICKQPQCLRNIKKLYKTIKTSNNRPILAKVIRTIKKRINYIKKKLDDTILHNKVKDQSKNDKKSNERSSFVKQSSFNLDFFEGAKSCRLPIRLYHLKDDPEERQNLANRKPQLRDKLLRRLMSYKHRYVLPDIPQDDPKGSPSLWGGAWSPGWC